MRHFRSGTPGAHASSLRCPEQHARSWHQDRSSIPGRCYYSSLCFVRSTCRIRWTGAGHAAFRLLYPGRALAAWRKQTTQAHNVPVFVRSLAGSRIKVLLRPQDQARKTSPSGAHCTRASPLRCVVRHATRWHVVQPDNTKECIDNYIGAQIVPLVDQVQVFVTPALTQPTGPIHHGGHADHRSSISLAHCPIILFTHARSSPSCSLGATMPIGSSAA